MSLIYLLGFTAAAYLLGSVSFAIVVSKLFRLADPRTFGSGNPGATNVLRTGNKMAAALTLLGDCVKGVVPVALAVYLSEPLGLGDAGVALISLAVFAGHLWPLFFRFKGGKGVATALGVLLGLNPILGGATLLTWIVIAYAFRYSSLAALISALFAPFYYTLLFGLNPIGFAVLVMSALLMWRHRQNIGNLIAGRESKIGGKSR
ncbi:MAG: glycerol-3-phosphate 1-O-acyltransferase PlsY [Burkholderiaceae bacterium]|jgi:glycerol-3-phosphate acyltransferase PlsY